MIVFGASVRLIEICSLVFEYPREKHAGVGCKPKQQTVQSILIVLHRRLDADGF